MLPIKPEIAPSAVRPLVIIVGKPAMSAANALHLRKRSPAIAAGKQDISLVNALKQAE